MPRDIYNFQPMSKFEMLFTLINSGNNQPFSISIFLATPYVTLFPGAKACMDTTAAFSPSAASRKLADSTGRVQAPVAEPTVVVDKMQSVSSARWWW